MSSIDDELQDIAVRKLRPSTRRNLARARDSLREGTAAFLIGAGFDRAIAGKKAPNWSQLVSDLLSTRPSRKEPLFSVDDWPLEMALWAKYRKPSQTAFTNAIAHALAPPLPVDMDEPNCSALGPLLVKSNLVVTFNYSEIVDAVVRRFARQRPIIVLDREDLAGFDFPRPTPGAEPDTDQPIFIIHLHGRCSRRSSPVLDAWGYNVVSNNDVYYGAFLEQLFTSRDVISIGVSWKDVPLRNAAALVRRTKGYVGRAHVFFQHGPRELEKEFQSNADSGLRGWANSMRASYGIDPIIATGDSQQLLAQHLAAAAQSPGDAPSIDDLPAVADFLDRAGDFESPQQVEWLLAEGARLTGADTKTALVSKAALHLTAAIRQQLDTDGSACWEVAARIERHLRHHLYLYARDTGLADRRALWESVASTAGRLTKSRWQQLDPQLRFDVLVGGMELGVHPGVSLSPLLEECHMSRLALASRVWTTHRGNPTDLALALLDVGWESLAAKVLGDQLLELINSVVGDQPTSHSSAAILEAAERAGSLARSAGAIRRRIKADTVAAMWDPDPRNGRLRILNTLRRGEVEQALEPGLYNGLVAGFLVSGARYYDGDPISVPDLLSELHKVLLEAGIRDSDLDAGQLRYWQPYAPAASKPILAAFATGLPGE